MNNKCNEKYKLGKPRRSLIEIIKCVNNKKYIVDIMSIKGIGGIVKKPEWFIDYEKKQDQFNNRVLDFINQQQEFNKQVLNRLDRHDELFKVVINQFKKHKWIK